MCFSCLFEQQVCFGLLQYKSLVTSVWPVLYPDTMTDMHIFPFASEKKQVVCADLIDLIFFFILFYFLSIDMKKQKGHKTKETDIAGK